MNFPISWLAPWSAMVAAAVFPPLVLLYFLKLRRREVPISSTLLWRRAVEDLQVNSPFQRLRNNLLLLLQLLILLLLVLAITEPVWKRAKAREKLMILLVDQSASMRAVESDGRTRLDHAKDAARRIVDDMGRNDQIMVIAFADRARAVASFTDDKAQLKRQIDAIEPTDGGTHLRDAMTLAEPYVARFTEELGLAADTIVPAHMILISDGCVRDADELVLRRGSMELVRIGESDENVAIVNMDVRRDYERPEMINVVVRMRNMGPKPASRDVSLFIDDELKDVVATGELAPNGVGDAGGAYGAASAPSNIPAEGSEKVVAFEPVAHEAAGRIEVRLSGRDPLVVDDRAYGTVEALRPVSTLLVTHGNYFLKTALAALPALPPVILSPEQYEQAKEEELLADGRMKYDVVVFDAHSTSRLPPGSYIFFGGVPKLDDAKIDGRIENEVVVDWDDTHPILRHVAVEIIHAVQSNRLRLPAQAETLIEGLQGPVLSLLMRDRRQYLICGFSLFDDERTHLNTNWVLNEGFPAFMYNALQFLAGNVTAGGNRSVRPGSAVAIPARPGVATVTIRRPDERTDKAPVRDGIAYYADTMRTGFYTADGAADRNATFAVNLFDDRESFIRPNEDFRVGAERVASTTGEQRVNRPLWPYLILAALAVLFVEWIVYNKRVLV